MQSRASFGIPDAHAPATCPPPSPAQTRGAGLADRLHTWCFVCFTPPFKRTVASWLGATLIYSKGSAGVGKKKMTQLPGQPLIKLKKSSLRNLQYSFLLSFPFLQASSTNQEIAGCHLDVQVTPSSLLADLVFSPCIHQNVSGFSPVPSEPLFSVQHGSSYISQNLVMAHFVILFSRGDTPKI